MIITLDGPAGSGKSSVARRLADELGFRFLNTGAMYRAVGLLCERAGTDLGDADACGRTAAAARLAQDGDRLSVDGEDWTELVRTPAAGAAASAVAVHPPVRAALVALQRAVGEAGDTVTEGRDQGTVVFPDAALKVFLTADAEARAERRRLELLAAGRDVPLAEVLAEVTGRDDKDERRAAAPLKPAADAVRYDTTGKPLEAVVADLVALARERGA
ncbi:(d)CMP kinase [Alienimonas californiensis]|uniref:Cytidylate kinase n=1 Tax=Alienimonas californiensis TaxID=2527989 RepID=A0A517PAN9_9PLAN|nr:(d)CMP kinase [Alienimonas californiensis]QDT16445.1 Cytidylate kinase [Alienimonas californiensis]